MEVKSFVMDLYRQAISYPKFLYFTMMVEIQVNQ